MGKGNQAVARCNSELHRRRQVSLGKPTGLSNKFLNPFRLRKTKFNQDKTK
jgi:hypothetical protein